MILDKVNNRKKEEAYTNHIPKSFCWKERKKESSFFFLKEVLLMVVLKLQSIQFFTAPPKEIRNRKISKSRFIRCGIAEASGEPAPLGQKTKYNDGPFEKVFMTLFARKMEKFANAKEQRKKKEGFWDFLYDYERFVDVSKRVMQGKNRMQQQLVVREVLLSMLPPGAPAQVIPFLIFSLLGSFEQIIQCGCF